MGTRGPKPLPANVHLLRGNPSKRPMGSLLDEFRPEVELPDCPSWVWPEAKKEWKRITPQLEKYGLVSRLDRAALVLYCQAWGEYVWAKKRLSHEMKRAEEGAKAAAEKGAEWKGGDGFMIPTPNGSFTYSPYWVAAKRAGDEVDKYQKLFGLSPSSRSRVTTSDNRQGEMFQEAGQDEWNQL